MAPAAWDASLASAVSEEDYDELAQFLSDNEDDDVKSGGASTAEIDGGVRGNFEKAVVVDGIPVAPESKKAKLEGVLSKVFGQFGTIQENGLCIPFATQTVKNKEGVAAERSMSVGFAFVVFETKESAAKAVSLADGFKLDKKHTFRVCMYTDLDKYREWPDKYVEPTMPAFKEPVNLRSWLADPEVRDQYVIREGPETKVVWAEGMTAAEGEAEEQIAYGGERQKAKGRSWCEMYVAWSPLGTFLATYHRQGIVLWGGPEFTGAPGTLRAACSG